MPRGLDDVLLSLTCPAWSFPAGYHIPQQHKHLIILIVHKFLGLGHPLVTDVAGVAVFAAHAFKQTRAQSTIRSCAELPAARPGRSRAGSEGVEVILDIDLLHQDML